MARRLTVVVLSLLSAVAFCALAASGASAKGTTAFTCAPVKSGGQFSDAHCTTESAGGGFAHQAIAINTTTNVELTNEKTKTKTTESTPSILAGTLAGVAVEIVCSANKGTGTVVNSEPEAKVMRSTGTMVIEQTKCTVAKPSKCKVAEPLTYTAKFEPFLKEGQMGLELTPKSGTQMGSFHFEGSECSLSGTFDITGSFGMTLGGTAEGKGVTLSFYTGIGSLQWGGKPYTLSGTITLSMQGGGNPITFTTSES